ncbi:Rieske (2Fe-2S) protein [Acetobacter sp. AN02]|uniref:Rieske (2Fe-2S) protein n=1 Tax=Acetobacter sp. AN02 TaxID=2894186 RepID=UPI0024345664|nr:Rieske (2Fe-2S) protein [Acetobacter sp. AN02]MDG6095284.1 Rieske (2Fe-2S) protein [Acetobacter sp. AN02]
MPTQNTSLPSDDLPPGMVCAVQAGELRLVLWRDADGVARAAEDLCPHRNVRLSGGYMTDGNLTCPAHGWEFGPDGNFTGSPDPSAEGMCLKMFAAREENGQIMISIAGPAVG